MAFTVTVTPGYVAEDGIAIHTEDFVAMATPNVSVVGAAGTSDISDGAITSAKAAPTFVSGFTAVSSLATDDLFLIHDTSGNVAATITVANAVGGILGGASAVTAFADYTADTIVFRQASDGSAKSMSTARFLEQIINQAPELTATSDTDGVVVTDASEAAGSKARLVSLANLLPDKIAAQTVANPTSIGIDAKGRVVSLGSSGTGARTSSAVEATETSLPTAAGYANAATVAHGLGARPSFVHAWLKCTDAGGDAGWAQNDVVGLTCVSFDTGASDHNAHYILVTDATNIRLVRPAIGSGSNGIIPNKSTGADDTFTPTKWKLLVAAIR